MEKGRIGLNAGKVWHALNEVNEISTQELSRKLSLEEFYKLKYCSTVVYMVPRA